MKSPSENHVHCFVNNASGSFGHRWTENDFGGCLSAVIRGMGEGSDTVHGNSRCAKWGVSFGNCE